MFLQSWHFRKRANSLSTCNSTSISWNSLRESGQVKLLLQSRFVIGSRCRSHYLIGGGCRWAGVSLKNPLNKSAKAEPLAVKSSVKKKISQTHKIHRWKYLGNHGSGTSFSILKNSSKFCDISLFRYSPKFQNPKIEKRHLFHSRGAETPLESLRRNQLDF